MFRVVPVLTTLIALSHAAHADEGDAAAKTQSVLQSLQKTGDPSATLKAAEELASLGADSVSTLKAFVEREKRGTDEARRAVLAAIDADVPNKDGRFGTQKRQTAEQKKRNDELDWLPMLAKLPKDTEALGEVIADVAAIRALAASRQPSAATVILDFAFTEIGLIYRDECGRYLRKMSPYSIPAMVVASQQQRKTPSRARYATYQLERLDRQNPHKALNAADAELKVQILKAFADSQYREAIYATLDHVDHVDDRVRKAARDAWLEYTTGRPPRKAPKRRLQMAGGKLSKTKQPLWLDHRELADIELRRKLEELTGTAPPANATLVEMNKTLFDFYDGRRHSRLEKSFAAGLQHAKAKEWEQAATEFDRVLAQVPNYDKRAQMADAFFHYGKSLQSAKKWHDASTAFAKAHAVDPEGPRAKEALAAHHYCRGQMQKGTAGDGADSIARAREIDPEHGGAASDDDATSGSWMLYGGIVWFTAGALLLALALHLRRRRTAQR